MSFRVPINLLSEQHKTQIGKDLVLKEKTNVFQYGGWQKKQEKPQQKEIRFFYLDEATNELCLPLFYSSCLFNKPFINLRRAFPQVRPFEINFALRDYQDEVVGTCLQNFCQRGTTFLNVFCAFGKTVVGAYLSATIAKQYGLATLVTYPRTLIGESWVGTFREKTNAKVYVIGESSYPPDPDTQIYLCMDTRLDSLDPWYRARIGHFIVDEAHMFCTSGHVRGLLSIEPIFMTILTATYERDDGFEKMIDLMAGPDRIIRISKKPFFVFQRPTMFTAEPKVGPRGILFDDLLQKLAQIEARNLMILSMVLDNMDQKPLILTRHVDHANNLTTWLNNYLGPYGKTATKLAGGGKKFNDADVIVATISKAGVGFDEENAFSDWGGVRVNLLILTASTKKIEQIAGRIFRSSDPVIFDIVDDFKNCKDHWSIRRKWYEARNGQIYMLPGHERFSWSQHREALKKGIIAQTPVREEPRPSDITVAHAAGIVARMYGKKEDSHAAGIVARVNDTANVTTSHAAGIVARMYGKQ